MKKSNNKHVLVAALAALTLTAGSSLVAARGAEGLPTEDRRAQRTISYADLNLASASGRAILERRIQSAARQVCGDTSYRNAGGLRQATVNRRCFDNAVAEALEVVTGGRNALASTD
ncbi:MAG TPA: UrcA family protein [Pseudohaliea sp.]|nr:UrcA family protein [Pseudohaliea sp.]